MSAPSVSVIIPVYNDPEGIRLTLESVTGQTYPTEDYEILAVDNNSTDGTATVIETYADLYDHVHALDATNGQSPGVARNEGIAHSRGETLAFIDADMTAPTDWISTMVDVIDENGWDYAGCPVATYPPKGIRTLGTLYDDVFAFEMSNYLDSSHFVGTGCLIVRSSVIDTVGDFDGRLVSSEDREFGKRVHDAGFSQGFTSDTMLYHPARASVSAHFRKNVRLGRGEHQMSAYYPNRFSVGGPANIRKWLPLHPLRFWHKLRQSDTEVSRREAFSLWALGSTSKIVRTVGMVVGRVETGQS